jgi:hypothetical protein
LQRILKLFSEILHFSVEFIPHMVDCLFSQLTLATTTEPMKLQLNKQSKGYYSSTHGTMTITVSDPSVIVGSKSQWQIIIQDGDEIVLNEFANTKRECYEFGVQFLMNDLV